MMHMDSKFLVTIGESNLELRVVGKTDDSAVIHESLVGSTIHWMPQLKHEVAAAQVLNQWF